MAHVFGSSIQLSNDFQGRTTAYSLRTTQHGFSADDPHQINELEPRDAGSHCTARLEVWGSFEHRRQSLQTHSATSSWRIERDFDITIASAPDLLLGLAGHLSTVSASSSDTYSASTRGKGLLYANDTEVGEMVVDGCWVRFGWESHRYVVAVQSLRRQYLAYHDDKPVLYAMIDWTYAKMGERNFRVAADCSVDCGQLRRALAVLVAVKVLSGA